MDNREPILIAKARKSMETGDFEAANSILAPLADANNPEALFLLSTFSVSPEETDADFEKRSLEYLTRAAANGYPAAMCALGVCFDIGDLVNRDIEKADAFFKRAAEAGDAKAMFFYGRNLFYSKSDSIGRETSLKYLKAAADAGVEDASDFLQQLKPAVDLSAYNLGQLKILSLEIDRAIKQHQKNELLQARGQILAIARELGLSIDDLIKGNATKLKLTSFAGERAVDQRPGKSGEVWTTTRDQSKKVFDAS